MWSTIAGNFLQRSKFRIRILLALSPIYSRDAEEYLQSSPFPPVAQFRKKNLHPYRIRVWKVRETEKKKIWLPL